MRDINEVIREREAALEHINEELSALRLTLRLLSEDSSQAFSLPEPKVAPAREEPLRRATGTVKSFP